MFPSFIKWSAEGVLSLVMTSSPQSRMYKTYFDRKMILALQQLRMRDKKESFPLATSAISDTVTIK